MCWDSVCARMGGPVRTVAVPSPQLPAIQTVCSATGRASVYVGSVCVTNTSDMETSVRNVLPVRAHGSLTGT